jgi:rod shape-determining protein MreD
VRYVLFILLGIVSIVLPGSVFAFANIGGIIPDLLLIIALCVVFLEKTASGIIFAAVAGIAYDVMFSSYIGLNAFAYVLVAAIAYAILRKLARATPLHLAIAGFFAYFAKELVLAFVNFLLGLNYDFFYMLARYILPGALITAALMIPAYYLIRILYMMNWMTPTKSLYEDFME